MFKKCFNLSLLIFVFLFSPIHAFKYAIVVNNSTYADPEWQEVVDTLYQKYSPDVEIITWNSSVWETSTALSNYQPDYIGFVCKPVTDLNESFVWAAHFISRDLDDDIYGDAVWGIITGFEASDAIRAITSELTVETVVASFPISNSTNPTLKKFIQSIGTFEAEAGPHVKYTFSDGSLLDTMDSANIEVDRTITFANWFNAESINISLPGHPEFKGSFDMFVTSGHANVNEWQAHYPDPAPEGFLRSNAGQLRADPYSAGSIDINSTNPKVYLAPGNCMIGFPNNINNMVYAWFHTGGATHMFGYIVNTWYGYQGWGSYNRFINFPGHFNVAEAFYITNQCLLFDIENLTPGTDSYGLVYDREAVVMYGDPAQNIKLYPFPDSNWQYSQNLIHIDTDIDTFIFSITANIDSVAPGPNNYPFEFLPIRIDPSTVVIESTDVIEPIITDNFVMLYSWDNTYPKLAKGETRFVRWTASEVSVNEELPVLKKDNFSISSANPFHSLLRINYSITTSTTVEINIYDISGRTVKNLLNLNMNPGSYNINWNGVNNFGQKVNSGIYFLIFKTDNIILKESIIFIQ